MLYVKLVCIYKYMLGEELTFLYVRQNYFLRFVFADTEIKKEVKRHLRDTYRVFIWKCNTRISMDEKTHEKVRNTIFEQELLNEEETQFLISTHVFHVLWNWDLFDFHYWESGKRRWVPLFFLRLPTLSFYVTRIE